MLKRVRAIPGVMVATITDNRLYVKVAAGDLYPVRRRVHPLLKQIPGFRVPLPKVQLAFDGQR